MCYFKQFKKMITRQIGWSNESNLLYQILKQITRLTSTLFSLKEAATPKYKVFTALLTQVGENSPTLVLGDETLNAGVTYEITVDTVVDMIQYGAPNNNIGTKFISNQTVSNWGDALNSLDYNQGAPVATVLENTIGNVWFIFGSSNGIYDMYTSSTSLENILYSTIQTYSVSFESVGTIRNSIFSVDYGNVRIQTQSTEDGTTWGFQNSLLDNTPIEIRVYN